MERVMLQMHSRTNIMREEREEREEKEEDLLKFRSLRSKKKVSADSESGYSSMMESGYSSNRDSASESK